MIGDYPPHEKENAGSPLAEYGVFPKKGGQGRPAGVQGQRPREGVQGWRPTLAARRVGQ